MTEVYLEIGAKKVFACALDWPGWARSGKDEHLALAALEDYTDRYAVIAKRARVKFAPTAFKVVEKLPGNMTTDFGAPDARAQADFAPLDAKEAARQGKLVRAAWEELDAVLPGISEGLRKGPRGGGRDRDKMLDHVLDAELSYARMIGLKLESGPIAENRAEILRLLSAPTDGRPLREKGWPSRYAARRIAWHVLDHLWEMQDKDLTE